MNKTWLAVNDAVAPIMEVQSLGKFSSLKIRLLETIEKFPKSIGFQYGKVINWIDANSPKEGDHQEDPRF